MRGADYFFFFFFQAEDGIRVHCVTGVQTCALPISPGQQTPRVRQGHPPLPGRAARPDGGPDRPRHPAAPDAQPAAQGLARIADLAPGPGAAWPEEPARRILAAKSNTCRSRSFSSHPYGSVEPYRLAVEHLVLDDVTYKGGVFFRLAEAGGEGDLVA